MSITPNGVPLLVGTANGMPPSNGAMIHPILQQIDQLNALYGQQLQAAQLLNRPGMAASQAAEKDSAEHMELGKMKEEGVHEAVRFIEQFINCYNL